MSSKKSYAPPPPDYSGLIAAQLQQNQVAQQQQQQQMEWAKAQFDKNSEISDRVINDAFARQDKLDTMAAQDRQRYQQVFQPVEDSLVQEAQDYASPARTEQRAGGAMSEVSQQFALARAAAQNRLEEFGIDPSQTRASALDLGTRLEEAKARASAGNMSREQTAAQSRAMRSEAINVGRGYPGQSAQSYALAGQSGGLASGTGLNTTQSGAGTMGTGLQWGALGSQDITAAGNLMKTGYDQVLDRYKLNQAERNQPSGWGTALGLIGGIGLAAAGSPATSLLGGGARKLFGMAEGGSVPEEMSPSGDAVTDDIPAQGPTGAIQLDGGEFVVPEDVVKWKGEEFFQKTIQKSREARKEAPAQPEVRQALAIHSDPNVRAAMGVPPAPMHPQALPLG
jgi:uncharacterized membrane-anchored protein YhcB (DUF1043 family)